jgi:lysophospholipase L1-like esterase
MAAIAAAGLMLAAIPKKSSSAARPAASSKKAAPAKGNKTPKRTASTKKTTPAKTTATAKTGAARKKTAARRRRYVRRPSIPSMPREVALVNVSNALRAGEELNGSFEPIDNGAALIPFFERLYRLKQAGGGAVHVLHYGDSHTASDDMPAVLRDSFQAEFGDGGPGYTLPGRPFPGYRRYDVVSNSSRGWLAEGTLKRRGDGMHGLAGVSITSKRFGETVTMHASAEQAELYFLRQPGGGNLDIWVDDAYRGTLSTDGEWKPMVTTLPGEPGPRRYLLRTATAQPIRLLGTVFQNSRGVTWETLGINGAHAGIIAEWDETLLGAHLTARDPALIVLAYGTNESNPRRWDAAAYEASLRGVITRMRGLAPAASLLLVGPPDYRIRNPQVLADLVECQRRVAVEMRCAFWDWRGRMGGPGSIRNWYFAGFAQRDLVHFTRPGYQLAGKTLYQDLMHLYARFSTVRSEAVNVASGEN